MTTTLTESDLEFIRKAFWDVSVDLATQIDLIYDDEDFCFLADTFDRLAAAGEALQKLGFQAPPAIAHLRRRFERSVA